MLTQPWISIEWNGEHQPVSRSARSITWCQLILCFGTNESIIKSIQYFTAYQRKDTSTWKIWPVFVRFTLDTFFRFVDSEKPTGVSMCSLFHTLFSFLLADSDNKRRRHRRTPCWTQVCLQYERHQPKLHHRRQAR